MGEDAVGVIRRLARDRQSRRPVVPDQNRHRHVEIPDHPFDQALVGAGAERRHPRSARWSKSAWALSWSMPMEAAPNRGFDDVRAVERGGAYRISGPEDHSLRCPQAERLRGQLRQPLVLDQPADVRRRAETGDAGGGRERRDVDLGVAKRRNVVEREDVVASLRTPAAGRRDRIGSRHPGRARFGASPRSRSDRPAARRNSGWIAAGGGVPPGAGACGARYSTRSAERRAAVSRLGEITSRCRS